MQLLYSQKSVLPLLCQKQISLLTSNQMKYLLHTQNAVIRSFVENPCDLSTESNLYKVLNALGNKDKPNFQAAINEAIRLGLYNGEKNRKQLIVNNFFSPKRLGGWFAYVSNMPYWLVSEKQDFTDSDTWATKIVQAYNKEHAFHLVNEYWDCGDDCERYQINAIKLTKNQVIELDIE